MTASGKADEVVASDLAEAQERARKAGPPHPTGSAADAAASGRNGDSSTEDTT